MRARSAWICAALVIVLPACGVPGGPLAPGEVAAVREVNERYADAWLMGDPEEVLALFTDDAVLLPHHGDAPVKGKASIRDHFWPPGSPPVEVTRFDMSPEEIMGRDGLACARGRFALEFRFGSAEDPRSYSTAGNYVMIFEKADDGDWRIAWYIWNDPVAVPAPPP